MCELVRLALFSFTLQPGTTGTSLGHWGGADDGCIHYPIRLTTLLLLELGRARSPPPGDAPVETADGHLPWQVALRCSLNKQAYWQAGRFGYNGNIAGERNTGEGETRHMAWKLRKDKLQADTPKEEAHAPETEALTHRRQKHPRNSRLHVPG